MVLLQGDHVLLAGFWVVGPGEAIATDSAYVPLKGTLAKAA